MPKTLSAKTFNSVGLNLLKLSNGEYTPTVNS
jgi:hypothetical protein